MNKIVLVCFSVLVAASAWAQSVNGPQVKAGDAWTYRNTAEKGPSGWTQTHDEVVVSRVSSSSIYFTVKANGSTQPAIEKFAGLDWSRARNVNGKETVVNQPLSFPLAPGKKWQLQYTEQHPNKRHASEQWDSTYTVVGYETVEVPAGKFNALKVEAEGHWIAELEPAQTIVQGVQSTAASTSMVTQRQTTKAEPATGRTYKAFWYVPDVRRWVKSVEEYYDAGGRRNERFTTELEAFKVSE
jgi:hypothetical protein